MSSCLHVMSMSSHSGCLVFPGPTGANHLDLQISSLDGKDAEDAASPLPVCAKSSITLTANLGAVNPWCRNWEFDFEKKTHSKIQNYEETIAELSAWYFNQKKKGYKSLKSQPKYRDCFVKKTGATKSHPFLLWARALFKTLPCFL